MKFCYPQNGEPFVVKGRWSDVYDKVREILGGAVLHKPNTPCLIHSLFYDEEDPHYDLPKTQRRRYEVEVPWEYRIKLSRLRYPENEEERKAAGGNRKRYFLTVDQASICPTKVIKAFRKVPRCWIKELDPIIEKIEGKSKPKVNKIGKYKNNYDYLPEHDNNYEYLSEHDIHYDSATGSFYVRDKIN